MTEMKLNSQKDNIKALKEVLLKKIYIFCRLHKLDDKVTLDNINIAV